MIAKQARSWQVLHVNGDGCTRQLLKIFIEIKIKLSVDSKDICLCLARVLNAFLQGV